MQYICDITKGEKLLKKLINQKSNRLITLNYITDYISTIYCLSLKQHSLLCNKKMKEHI